MIKKISLIAMLMLNALAYAQPGDDDVIYFTDSKVKHSRFSAALLLNPNYTSRRLINDEIPSGGGFDLPTEEANGAFQLNYNLDVFYSIGPSFDVGIGFGRSSAYFEVNDVSYYQNRLDTVNADLSVRTRMYTVPIKFNFNTTVTDLWDLEVVPGVELNFFDVYDQTFSPDGEEDVYSDLSSMVESFNYSVNLSLGGTYKLSDNWGLVIRGNVRYLLKPIIEESNFPRETIYNFGANIGLKYDF